MNKYWPMLLLFLGGLTLTGGDIIMKEWVIKEKNYLYILGMIIYLIGLNFLAQTFKYKNIAVASVIFVTFNVLTLSIISWMFYHEKLSFLEITGLLLGIISINILEFAHN